MDVNEKSHLNAAKSGIVTGGSSRRFRLSLRLAAIIVGCLIVLAGVTWLVIDLLQSPASSRTGANTQQQKGLVSGLATVCPAKTIEQASQAIVANDIAATYAVDQQIVALKNYKQDPNCVYIALRYAIMSGNVSASQGYYNQLSYISQQSGGLHYSSAFVQTPLSLANLSASMKVIEANQSTQQALNEDTNNDLQTIDNREQQAHGTNQ